MTALTDPRRVPKPLREVVRRTIGEGKHTRAVIAGSLGLDNPSEFDAYLDGKIRVHFNFVMLFAAETEIDYAYAIRCWLAETIPDLLRYLDRQPAPPLLTANERRFIERVREYTDDGDGELVLVDGNEVLGFVLSK